MWSFLGQILGMFARQVVFNTLSKRQANAGKVLQGVDLAKQFLGSNDSNQSNQKTNP